VRADIVPGGTFPDYELTDHTRTRRRLSELQGIDPMILLLSRGHYCPKDAQQHLELAASYPKIAVSYTQLVTISTDNLLETNEFRAAVGAQWTFLSDAGRHVQKDLDIAEYTDPHHDPMIPHTLVLKPGLVIHSIYNGYWFWGRPSFEDLRRDLREVTREVRPDWDLGGPGLRAEWQAGDKGRGRHTRPAPGSRVNGHDLDRIAANHGRAGGSPCAGRSVRESVLSVLGGEEGSWRQVRSCICMFTPSTRCWMAPPR